MAEKRLTRKVNEKKIAGVCAGVADYFGLDVAMVRLVWAISFLFLGAGGFLYALLWFLLPESE
jgi:pspC domain protein